VAGARAGLAGNRSGLFFEIVRIVREMREATDGLFPKYVVLENVPGLLSSHGGRDFAVVLGELAGLGAVDIGWRVCDAQYWAVAQRRRRVFVVASFTDRRSTAEILSLSSGGSWHTPPRREAGEGAAGGAAVGAGVGCAVADTLSVGANQTTGFVGDVGDHIPVMAGTVSSKWAKGTGGPAGDEVQNLIPATTHSLTAAGHDASEDGTGRGTPLVPIAFSSKDSGHDASADLAPTLRAMNYAESHINGGGQVAIAYAFASTGGGGGACSPDDLSPKLAIGSGIGIPSVPAIAFTERTRADGRNVEAQADLAYPVRDGGAGTASKGMVAFPLDLRNATRTTERDEMNRQGTGVGADGDPSPTLSTLFVPGVATAMAVRRLLPIECCRLQGFPDWWLDDLGLSDSAKYRMLGNAVCVSVAEWLASRLA
jgi:DNA (cytosine-5)-methyltransferase 1